MINKKACSYAIATVLSATTGLAIAQPASSTSQHKGFLEEITVTARKREESQQSIPVAITAIGVEELRKKMINDPYDLGTQISD